MVFRRAERIYLRRQGNPYSTEVIRFGRPFSDPSKKLRTPDDTEADRQLTTAGPFVLGRTHLFATEEFSYLGAKIWMVDLLSGSRRVIFENEQVIPPQFNSLNGEKRVKDEENWEIRGMALSPDEQKLVFIKSTYYYPGEGSWEIGDLILWEVNSGQFSLLTDFCRRRNNHYYLENLRFSPDGKQIAFTGFTPYANDAMTYILKLPEKKDDAIVVTPIEHSCLVDWIS